MMEYFLNPRCKINHALKFLLVRYLLTTVFLIQSQIRVSVLGCVVILRKMFPRSSEKVIPIYWLELPSKPFSQSVKCRALKEIIFCLFTTKGWLKWSVKTLCNYKRMWQGKAEMSLDRWTNPVGPEKLVTCAHCRHAWLKQGKASSLPFLHIVPAGVLLLLWTLVPHSSHCPVTLLPLHCSFCYGMMDGTVLS